MSGTLQFSRKKALIPPLSLATIAALTPPEFSVEIIDETIEEIDFNQKYDLVGITGYTMHSKRMFEISRDFRKRGVLTIGGGPFCSGNTEDCKPHFDVLVCGEAEKVWGEFLSDFTKGDYKNLYQGEEKMDLSISPIPRWDLVKLDQYNIGIVQTSRGCPFDCEFCDVVSLFGQGNRYKPLENIIKEIKLLVKMGKPEIFLADDNLIGQRRYVKELLKELIALNKTLKHPLRYITQLTLDVAKDPELLDLFKDAGFFLFFIGIESPNKESLVSAHKEHNLRLDIKESVQIIQSRGIVIFAGMIVGFDTDNPDIFQLQNDFFIEAGLTVISMGMLVAYRGTKLWDRMEKEGRLLPQPEGLDIYTTSQNFIPKMMTAEELKEGYIKLLTNIYAESHYLKRFQSFIRQLDLKHIKGNSSSSFIVDLKNVQFELLAFAFRVVCYYIFNPNKKKRRLFWSVLLTGLKKGIVCLPLVISSLCMYKSMSEFVENEFLASQDKIQDN